jgi:hypothetical protein
MIKAINGQTLPLALRSRGAYLNIIIDRIAYLSKRMLGNDSSRPYYSEEVMSLLWILAQYEMYSGVSVEPYILKLDVNRVISMNKYKAILESVKIMKASLDSYRLTNTEACGIKEP